MSEAFWALGRSTGLIALGLLTLAVVIGVVARSGRPAVGMPRFAVQAVHRATALTAVVFVGLHVTSLFFDPYAQLRLVDVLVPFHAARNPFWVGLGTATVDLLIAVTITGLLRTRIGPHAFHIIHVSTYVLWPMALLHAIGSGSDVAEPWFIIPVLGALAAVSAACAWRLSPKFHDRSAERRSALSSERTRTR